MTGSVTFVLGLAGSGKSHYIAKHVGHLDFVCQEGFMARRLHERNHRMLVRQLRAGADCWVSEIQLLRRYMRDGYLLRLRKDVPRVRVRWVFFENNPERANWNCRWRKNKPGDPRGKGHIQINANCSPYYELPPRVKPVRIYKIRRRR